MAAKPVGKQAELESPAKVYQLYALDDKVTTLNKQFELFSSEMTSRLDEILKETRGVITRPMLDVVVKELEDGWGKQITELEVRSKDYADTKVREVDLKFSPMKKWQTWLVVTFGGAFIAGLANFVWTLISR